jgi:hypothetical protein
MEGRTIYEDYCKIDGRVKHYHSACLLKVKNKIISSYLFFINLLEILKLSLKFRVPLYLELDTRHPYISIKWTDLIAPCHRQAAIDLFFFCVLII